MEQSALERGDFSKGGEAGELTLETNQDRFLCGKVEILEVEELKWPVVYHLPAFLMEKGNGGISSSVGGKCLGLWEDYRQGALNSGVCVPVSVCLCVCVGGT